MKSLLIVIDFINDIVHPQGKLASVADMVGEHQVIEHANRAIAQARNKCMPIVHVKIGFSSDYCECPSKSPMFGKLRQSGALKLGEWGTEFHQSMDVQLQDRVIVKHRVSALYATPLATILTANQIDTVFIAGVSTNNAVETLARELHDRDYQVMVLEDACAASTNEIHQASLVTLRRMATVGDVATLMY